MPDLNQDNDFVRSTLKAWVKDTVQKYNIDGLRVDTAPEVKREFWSEYTEAAGVFTIGEVFNGDMNLVASYQGHLDATLNYPMYYTLNDVFRYGKSMYELRSIFENEAKAFQDTSVLGLFIDNHDNERFRHQQHSDAMLKGALTYIMTA